MTNKIIQSNIESYPHLVYTAVRDDIIVPPMTDLRIGASWSHLQPNVYHFLLRQALFEDYVFPYDLITEHFKVNNGILLWGYDKLNLSAFTQISEPNNVYFKVDGQFIARMTFARNVIYLTEKIEK